MRNNTPTSDDAATERHMRKRLAARVRQQRCRARKREAKLAKANRDVKPPRPNVFHHHHPQVVRGPVLIRSPPRVPMFRQPTSAFTMYPRRAPSFPPPSPGSLWAPHRLPPTPHSPPIARVTSIPPPPYHSRPFHQEIMSESALALGMCRTPPTSHRFVHIPRVSPVAESTNTCRAMVPVMPELDHLERNEEAAIDAMLSLGRPSKSTQVMQVREV